MREFRSWSGWDRFLGCVGASISALGIASMIIALIAVGEIRWSYWWFLLVAVLLFVALPVTALTGLRMANEKLVVAPNGLTYTGLLKRQIFLPTNEVLSLRVDLNAFNQKYLEIKSSEERIAILSTLRGFDDLVSLLKQGELGDRFK